MFLDNEVFEMCKKTELKTSEDIQNFYAEVCTKFDKYRRDNMDAAMTNKQLKIIVNKTFNLWDSFVRMCLKSKDKKLLIMGNMFQKHSFKKMFLKDEKMRKLYNSL